MINMVKKGISVLALLVGMLGMILSTLQLGVSRDIDILLNVSKTNAINPAIYHITILLSFLICVVGCAMCYFSFPQKAKSLQDSSFGTTTEKLVTQMSSEATELLSETEKISSDNDATEVL